MDEEMDEAIEEAEEVAKTEMTPWTSVDLYFKGFHIKKSIPANISPDSLKKRIEEYILAGFEPSWNTETNLKTKSQPIPLPQLAKPATQTMICSFCGQPAEYKEGISKDKIVNGVTIKGKPYKVVFCSTQDKSHTKWL